MRWWLWTILLAGCGSGAVHENANQTDQSVSDSQTVQITGAIYPYDGDWLIVSIGGGGYDPLSPLDARWQKPGLPVRAVVRIHYELNLGTQLAERVDVLHLEQLSCSDLPCAAPPPAVTVVIAAAGPSSTASFYNATLANVVRPAGSVGPESGCVTASDTPTSPVIRKCWINGFVSGVYEADVSAPGFETKHVRFEVPVRDVQPYECCAVHYVPQGSWVFLSPSP